MDGTETRLDRNGQRVEVVAVGGSPARALTLLIGLPIEDLAQRLNVEQPWLLRETLSDAPKSLFRLAELVSRTMAPVIVSTGHQEGRIVSTASYQVGDALRAAEAAKAAHLLTARTPLSRAEMDAVVPAWKDAIGIGATPGEAVRQAVLAALRLPDVYGVETRIARALGLSPNAWDKARRQRRRGGLDELLDGFEPARRICASTRGWSLSWAPSETSGGWIAGSLLSRDLP